MLNPEQHQHQKNSSTPVMTLSQVGKSYGSVSVLRKIDLDIIPGQIHAIMGENGAGKSTLVKILSGVIQPSSGSFCLDGKPVQFQNPSDAKKAGVIIMHQELSLIPEMSVADNVTLGQEPIRKGVVLDKTQA